MYNGQQKPHLRRKETDGSWGDDEDVTTGKHLGSWGKKVLDFKNSNAETVGAKWSDRLIGISQSSEFNGHAVYATGS